MPMMVSTTGAEVSAIHQENHIKGQGLQRSESVSACTCWARLVCGGLPCLLACAASTAQGEGACPHYVDRIDRARPAVQRAGEGVCRLVGASGGFWCSHGHGCWCTSRIGVPNLVTPQPCTRWTASRGRDYRAGRASAAAHAGRCWCAWRCPRSAGQHSPRCLAYSFTRYAGAMGRALHAASASR